MSGLPVFQPPRPLPLAVLKHLGIAEQDIVNVTIHGLGSEEGHLVEARVVARDHDGSPVHWDGRVMRNTLYFTLTDKDLTA